MKICQKCKKQYTPNSNAQKRCYACQHIFCKYCGKGFVPANHTLSHKYCSDNCHYSDTRSIRTERINKNRGKKPRTYYLKHRQKHGSAEERDWRQNVFQRDGWTCQKCGQVGGRLQAHHKIPYQKEPSLRFVVSNGITLCIKCHKETDTYGWANYWKSQKRDSG